MFEPRGNGRRASSAYSQLLKFVLYQATEIENICCKQTELASNSFKTCTRKICLILKYADVTTSRTIAPIGGGWGPSPPRFLK